jgi:hypothetical protein
MTPETMQRLKAALSGRESVDIGHFQWVNLDMVRAEAGKKWDTLREKVYSASAHFIEKRLSEHDVLVRCRGGFIIVYADCGDKEARERTELISQQLNLFFLGDRILQQFEISARSESVSVADMADFVSRVEKKGADDAAAPRKSRKKQDTGDEHPASGQWCPIDHEALDTRAGGYTVDAEAGENGAVAHQAEAEERPDLSAHVCESAGARPDATPRSSTSYLTDGLFSELDKTWDDIVFKPFWDVRFNYITANFCMARRRYRGRMLYGRDTLLGNDSPSLHRALDHAVVIAAQRGFLRRYAEGEKCMIAIPVNYDTIIGVADRVRYFSILQCVPQRMRKYFYIRVDNIPDGAPMGQMEELFRAMRCFGSNILAKIPLGTVQLSRFDNCGIAMFSSQLSRSGTKGAFNEATVAKLAAQAVSIKRIGARGCLTQVETMDQLTACLDAGYEVFAGDVIGRDRDRPAKPSPCTLDDLMRRNSQVA